MVNAGTAAAAGAGAGIAATFNAPLGGIAFAIELLLVSVDARSLVVVATAGRSRSRWSGPA
jgi:chloride channel protein, CIC family